MTAKKIVWRALFRSAESFDEPKGRSVCRVCGHATVPRIVVSVWSISLAVLFVMAVVLGWETADIVTAGRLDRTVQALLTGSASAPCDE
jgi:hypothetical protein